MRLSCNFYRSKGENVRKHSQKLRLKIAVEPKTKSCWALRIRTSLFLTLEGFWRERDCEVGVAVVLVAAAADAELVAVGLGGVAEEGPLLRLEQVGGQAAVAHADLVC